MSKQAFLCGYRPSKKKLGPLTKADRKAIRNFKQFLRGKGSRCPECLHKATKHWTTCLAKDCDCRLSSGDVVAVRAQLKVRGWERDGDPT